MNTLELMTYLVFFQPREVWASWLSLEVWQGETVPGNPLSAVTINLGSPGSKQIEFWETKLNDLSWRCQ